MTFFLSIATVVGILLGLRFKVFILGPASLIAACTIIATGHGGKIIAATILATTALLQIGYLLSPNDTYRQERRGLGHSKPAWF
jgi:hypothetical protein